MSAVLLVLLLAQSPQQPQNQAQQPSGTNRPDAASSVTPQSPLGQQQTNNPPNTAEQDSAPARPWLRRLAAWIDGMDPNRVIAVFTVVLAVFTYWQVRIALRNEEHMRVIERAYIKLFHNPPGLVFALDYTAGNSYTYGFQVRVRVDNLGNTPALVVKSAIGITKDLPDVPDYRQCLVIETNAHLVKDAGFTITHPYKANVSGGTAQEAFNAFAASGQQLHVIGYVEYFDKFGFKHRCGYGRTYAPYWDDVRLAIYRKEGGGFDEVAYNNRNNLNFILKAGYNYDVVMERPGVLRRLWRRQQRLPQKRPTKE